MNECFPLLPKFKCESYYSVVITMNVIDSIRRGAMKEAGIIKSVVRGTSAGPFATVDRMVRTARGTVRNVTRGAMNRGKRAPIASKGASVFGSGPFSPQKLRRQAKRRLRNVSITRRRRR